MSLINDALRRASQSDKERPRQVSTSSGMEPAPVARKSRVNLIISAVVVVVVLLAGWFFWQWWIAHVNEQTQQTLYAPPASRPALNPAPSAPPPAPVAQTSQPKPALAPAAPTEPLAPAPVAVAPAKVPVADQAMAPAGLPNISNFAPTPWPVDLKLGGIFYREKDPRALINGTIYGVGDNIDGVVVKKIETDKVTVEWKGHLRMLSMGGS